MKIFNNIADLREELDRHRLNGEQIGLVPTMGALHQGHISLIKKSLGDCDLTVCSIFVNPTQFNNPEDLVKYPTRIEADQELLKEVGCDILFLPAVHEMYPEGSEVMGMTFGPLEQVLEGAFRPGHFSGVGVVVAKLLNIVGPDSAFFGQKDLQQLAVIRKLVKDLNIPTSIVGVPTLREANGLAMSSRNLRLSESEREQASALYHIMCELKNTLLEGADWKPARDRAVQALEKAEGVKLEYLEMVNSDTLMAVSDLKSTENVSICVAAHIAQVRIIDNLYVKKLA